MSGFNLSTDEFAEGFKNNPEAIILDVRRPDEFEEGHLPGALNINVMSPDFSIQLDNLDHDKAYYVYCKSGGRSTSACLAMQSMGFTEVYNMVGGIMAWNGDVE